MAATARRKIISCPAGAWTKLTDGAVSLDVSVEIIDGSVEIQPTSADAEPGVSTDGARFTFPGSGWSQATIAEIYPDLAAGAYYLWARPLHSQPTPAKVWISHATEA